jgi:hypothetical protein
MTAHRTALIILTLLFMAGCGPPAAVVSSSDACSLLTQAEVSTALGVTLDPGERPVPTETHICIWREHGKDQMRARNVRISLLNAGDFKGGRPSPLLKASTPEIGVGEEAYFTKAIGMVYLLSVKKGDVYFRVQARSNPDALPAASTADTDRRDQEIDRALAQVVLKKL